MNAHVDPRRAAQVAAITGNPAFERQTDLLMALQAYGQTGTAKLQLVADLKAALTHQFGPVAGRTIAQMAGE